MPISHLCCHQRGFHTWNPVVTCGLPIRAQAVTTRTFLFIFPCESKSFSDRNYLFLMSHLLKVECGLQNQLDFFVSGLPGECRSLKQSLILGDDGCPFCYKLLLSLIVGLLCLCMSNHFHWILLVLLLAKFQPFWCSLLSNLFFLMVQIKRLIRHRSVIDYKMKIEFWNYRGILPKSLFM